MEKQSELTIITKVKNLCSYIITVTQKSPKQFRFTFTSRLQNLCMDILEDIYLANQTFVSGVDSKIKRQKRLDYQYSAMTKIKMLAYFCHLAFEQKAILLKQFEQISKQAADCQFLLGSWIKSDKNRFG